MKSNVLFLILFAFLISFYGCCDDDDEKMPEKHCHLNLADNTPVEMTITFKVEQTGDGEVTTLIYETSDSNDSIDNPELPWEIEALAAAGTNFRIEAIGATSNGTLTISYFGVSWGTEMSGEETCTHEQK